MDSKNTTMRAGDLTAYQALEDAVRNHIAMYQDTSDEFNLSGSAILAALDALDGSHQAGAETEPNGPPRGVDAASETVSGAEIKRLYLALAGETLRADQGWARYEAANKKCQALDAAIEAYAIQNRGELALLSTDLQRLSGLSDEACRASNAVARCVGKSTEQAIPQAAPCNVPDSESDAQQATFIDAAQTRYGDALDVFGSRLGISSAAEPEAIMEVTRALLANLIRIHQTLGLPEDQDIDAGMIISTIQGMFDAAAAAYGSEVDVDPESLCLKNTGTLCGQIEVLPGRDKAKLLIFTITAWEQVATEVLGPKSVVDTLSALLERIEVPVAGHPGEMH